MKKTSSFLFLMLCVATLSLVSCKKNDDDGGSGGSEYFVSFKADGTAFNVESPLAYGTEFSDTYGIYAVYNKDNSTKDDDRLLYIILEKDHGVGKHTLTTGFGDDKGVWIVGDGATDDQEFFTYNDTVGGFVEITSKTDTEVEGTFSFSVSTFNATQKTSITEGKFKVKFN